MARSVSEFEPELAILPALAASAGSRRALDIGANRGNYAAAMRAAGFEVDCFEPLPSLARELRSRFAGDPLVRVHEIACSDVDGTAELQQLVTSQENLDATLFSSIVEHPSFQGLEQGERITVKTKRLDSLFTDQPTDRLGFVKIDTEGHDLAVVQGLGKLRPAAMLLEFWDEGFVFNMGQTRNRLADYETNLDKSFYRYSALFWRGAEAREFGTILNAADTPPESWGNVLYMSERPMFEAVKAAIANGRQSVSDLKDVF